MHEHEGTTGWARFWNKGGWWRALLIVVVYTAAYQGIGYVTSSIFGQFIDSKNLLSTPESIFFAYALPILIAGVLLFLFVASVGWTKEIFGRQPLQGKAWMWLAVVLVLIPNILRFTATSWSSYSVTLVLAMLFTGLCIGFAEELITRGVAVNLLRRGGHTERVAMVVSSALFALMHSVNIFTGQSPLAVGVTVVYTFGFGAMMYLAMRLTGSIIVPILLHASTDPSTFLATGAIDAHGATAGDAGLISIAGLFNWVYILFAVVAIFLVKGRAKDATAS
jgi:membrane protease YdiL (CAAX protease family)